MRMELINILTFFVLVAGFHATKERLQPKLCKYVKTGHVAVLAGALSHPITWEGIQHYLVHFVVYSGYMIPKH